MGFWNDKRDRKYWMKAVMSRRVDLSGREPPVVVGALGGAGTRLLVSILRRAGVFMGSWVDHRTEDSQPFRVFLTRWFNPLVSHLLHGTSIVRSTVDADFERSLRIHLMAGGDGRWGWKNPRNMWLLPFYAARYPDMKFLHLIRDGRDMALSDNQNLLRDSGRLLLGSEWQGSPVESQLALWELGNKTARTRAQALLAPGNYLLVRYEDLCLRPAVIIPEIIRFVGGDVEVTDIDALTALVRPSSRIGTGAGILHECAHIDPHAFGRTLECFGYQP
ncbi:MAG TPA: sulfotransferase [Azoarcus taiwanensis]|nr:sulfotransferase [Rhodocyclaceae bacterium]HRQ47599.1 sulfotransferase [Rhodocyclaceae bacterium]HRQ59594.1 sulfotransferase [Azoarcus taiwanensis]